jgi:hypothetical protein
VNPGLQTLRTGRGREWWMVEVSEPEAPEYQTGVAHTVISLALRETIHYQPNCNWKMLFAACSMVKLQNSEFGIFLLDYKGA